jgi:hypothetical protein
MRRVRRRQDMRRTRQSACNVFLALASPLSVTRPLRRIQCDHPPFPHQNTDGDEIDHLFVVPVAASLAAAATGPAGPSAAPRAAPPAVDLTPYPGVKAMGIVDSRRAPGFLYVGLNRRDSEVRFFILYGPGSSVVARAHAPGGAPIPAAALAAKRRSWAVARLLSPLRAPAPSSPGGRGACAGAPPAWGPQL